MSADLSPCPSSESNLHQTPSILPGMSVGNPKSESKTKDVDISIEDTSQLLESGDTTPTSGHQSSSFLQDNAVTTDMDPKRPSPGTERLPSLPDGGKPETEHRAVSGPSEQRFDLMKLTRTVASLLESECPSLLHDHRFDNPNIRARHPKEFDELKYKGSPIKPGVLNILSLIDVCL